MIREALKGLTVIDFTQIGAGPTSTMLLGDMGARVIKVEPIEGEVGRSLGPAWVGQDAALYHGFNRSKQGIALNIKTESGREVAHRLIQNADIAVESMRPGAMARVGLSYEQVKEQCPRLIYCSISAYGQTGPYAARAGVDGVLQADSGLMSLIGSPNAGPCKVQAPVVDITTGYMACMGILALVAQRERTGLGSYLDASLFNSAVALQQSSMSSYFADGKPPAPMGSAAPYSAPNQAFETADGWIMVAAYTPTRWQKLCQILERTELLTDSRFETSPLRVQHLTDLVKTLTESFRTRTSTEWLRDLEKADILCAKVANYDDLISHPQACANRMFVNLDAEGEHILKVPGFPLNSCEANALPYEAAPKIGEHTSLIMGELGYSDEIVESLHKQGAVFCGQREVNKC